MDSYTTCCVCMLPCKLKKTFRRFDIWSNVTWILFLLPVVFWGSSGAKSEGKKSYNGRDSRRAQSTAMWTVWFWSYPRNLCNVQWRIVNRSISESGNPGQMQLSRLSKIRFLIPSSASSELLARSSSLAALSPSLHVKSIINLLSLPTQHSNWN